jgi:ABC-type multidrug transport system ATPase subunit
MVDIIVAENISKSYGKNVAVDKLNLRVKEGEFFGFLGPNGAGKTTTIRMLTGILKPDSGEISINQSSLKQQKEISQKIGVVPESRGFYDWMTAVEYLSFFGNLYGFKKTELKNQIENLLTQVGLKDRKNSLIGTYSRGMRQRLGLARAIINNPSVIFLDEPTLGLDPQGQIDIQQLLKKLNSQGTTIFLSSHLLDEVSSLCSRFGIINKGKLVAEGTIDELRKTTNLQGKNLTEIFLYLTKNE